MPATTILETVNLIDDMRVNLVNASVARKLSIGTEWNKLRIGLRFCMEPGGTNIAGKAAFVGVCSGTEQPWNNGAALTKHCFGQRFYNASRPVYNAGGYYDTGGFAYAARRIGTTTALSSYGISSPAWWPAHAELLPIMWFVDITKGGSWSCKPWAYYTSTKPPYYSYEQFLEYVVIESPILANHSSGSWTGTLSIDEETNGYMDSVNIGWEGPIPMKICEVAIVRFA